MKMKPLSLYYRPNRPFLYDVGRNGKILGINGKILGRNGKIWAETETLTTDAPIAYRSHTYLISKTLATHGW